MQIMCSYCDNIVGQYTPKVKGRAVNTVDIRTIMPIICKNNRMDLGPEMTLNGVDSKIYSVREKKMQLCGKKLNSFVLRSGKVWGL